MSDIQFYHPQITGDSAAPISIENKGFPYNQLADHRRFEELVYSIFVEKIGHNKFHHFDKISLMSGVQDKGRDCTLYTSSRFTGLIQCKKYKNSLSKDQFGKELIKFLLCSLIYDELKFDPTNFSYFIAASGGYANSCIDFINSYKLEIHQEKNLDSWIKPNLLENRFSEISFKNAKEYVIKILQNISIKEIAPQDLDSYLIRDHQDLISLFFQIRSVPNFNEFKKVNEKLDHLTSKSLNREQIQEQLSWGSQSLKLENNEFDEIPDSHIARNETEELYQWIHHQQPIEKAKINQNICILAGDAGMGKTVILKDLYEKLEGKSIPVLGLKADKLYVDSINDLQQRIGLSLPVIQFLDRCSKEFDQVVLIVDQLDALSQSMSSERKYLLVFKSLIDYFTHKPNIQIILSVRLKDLYYDPSLKSYRHIKNIQVSLLTVGQVIEQLSKIQITKEQLSAKLLELLRVPHHLNIFSRIAVKTTNFLGLDSIHDLYSELWQQQLINKPERLNLKPQKIQKLLYKIVTYFFDNQITEVHQNHFENFSKELNYLESEHLIKCENNQIQLFHQTFYDFIFAKRFVEKKLDLLEYVLRQEQSLLIRSAIKMIINYLRDYNRRAYHLAMDTLLNDNRIYFHIKHLLISHIAFQEEPTDEEVGLLFMHIKNSVPLQILLFEMALSSQWFHIVLAKNRLSFFETPLEESIPHEMDKAAFNRRFLRKTGLNYLSYFINKGNSEAWEFVLTIDNQEIKQEVLFRIVDWSNANCYELFDQCLPMDIANYWHQSVLANIAKERPELAWNHIKTKFLSDAYLEKAYPHDHSLITTLKLLTERIPDILITELKAKIENDLTRKPQDQEEDDILFQVNPYEHIDLEMKEDLNGKSFLYQLLGASIRNAAQQNLSIFQEFLENNRDSSLYPILQLVMYGLQGREAENKNTIYHLLLLFNKRNRLDYYGPPGVTFRKLLESAFPFFTKTQQYETLQIIENLKVASEAYVFKRPEKSYYTKSWGQSKLALLKRIPLTSIRQNPHLYKEYQELHRKFPAFEDPYSQGSMAGVVQRPLTARAYKHMTKKQWLSSFKKYNKERTQFQSDYLKGGLHEHSWGFREMVKNDPTEAKIKIIKKSIGDPEIDSSYPILGLSGLCDAEGDPLIIRSLFKEILETRNYSTHFLPCIRIAEYLIRKEKADQEIYDFLFATSRITPIDHQNRFRDSMERSAIHGLVTAGINSVHGSVAQAIAYSTNKEMESAVFEFVQHIFTTHNKATKAALLFRYAYLMHLNKEKAFNMYIKYMSEEEDVFVLASSLSSLSYLTNYKFGACVPILKKLVDSEKLGHEDTGVLTGILLREAIRKKEGPSSLIFELLSKNANARNATFYQIIKHYNEREDSKAYCNQLLLYALKNIKKGEHVKRHRYFFKMDHISLPDIYPFLKEYVNSTEFVPSDRFVSYLLQESHRDPKLAISLFQSSLEKKFDVRGSEYFLYERNNLVTKFIVGAFHALNEMTPETKELRKKLLELLDVILQDMRYWQKNTKMLQELT